MLCDNCSKSEAVIHLTRIVDEKVVQNHLCESCAATLGIETTISLPQIPLVSSDQEVSSENEPLVRANEPSICSFCGSSPRDFEVSGRLGCSHCYDVMQESLRELMRRLHGSTTHSGRKYQAPLPETILRIDVRKELSDRLLSAVKSEQFEVAAEIRDRLRLLDI